MPSNSTSVMKDDLLKPMRLLLFEGKYALASVTVVMTSMSFVMALSIRDVTSTCVSSLLGVGDPMTTRGMCASSVLQGFSSFFIIFIIATVVLKCFLTAQDKVSQLF